jgi:hypothetical protein
LLNDQLLKPFKEWLKENKVECNFSEESWNILIMFNLFSEFVMETQAALMQPIK